MNVDSEKLKNVLLKEAEAINSGIAELTGMRNSILHAIEIIDQLEIETLRGGDQRDRTNERGDIEKDKREALGSTEPESGM